MGLFGRKNKKQEKEMEKSTGAFVGFVLLDETCYDFRNLVTQLRDDWGIVITEADIDFDSGVVTAEVDGMMAAISLITAPVPHDEAVANARTNYAWQDAVNAAENHKAHVLVAVLRHEASLLDAGALYVKLLSSIAKADTATGINILGSVLHPKAYGEIAELALNNGDYPVMNLVFVGIYSSDGGQTYSGYTYGMAVFGKYDMEVLNSGQNAQDIYSFLYDIAGYVILQDAVLRDGETIGFTEEQKLGITFSEGVALPEMTLKIEY